MRYLIVGTMLLLAACGSQGGLDYVSSVNVVPGPAVITAVTGTDRRDEKPNRLATVRGGFGNPIYVLDTKTPVIDEVVSVVTKGLQARGMLAAAAPYRIDILLRHFDVNQYITANAGIEIELRVLDRSGATIYQDAVKDERTGKFEFLGGAFTDIKVLNKLGQDLLNSVVDRMLDKPAFRVAIGRVS